MFFKSWNFEGHYQKHSLAQMHNINLHLTCIGVFYAHVKEYLIGGSFNAIPLYTI
jgi:hypothetical protein